MLYGRVPFICSAFQNMLRYKHNYGHIPHNLKEVSLHSSTKIKLFLFPSQMSSFEYIKRAFSFKHQSRNKIVFYRYNMKRELIVYIYRNMLAKLSRFEVVIKALMQLPTEAAKAQ